MHLSKEPDKDITIRGATFVKVRGYFAACKAADDEYRRSHFADEGMSIFLRMQWSK
jgi:hypothetical protein